MCVLCVYGSRMALQDRKGADIDIAISANLAPLRMLAQRLCCVMHFSSCVEGCVSLQVLRSTIMAVLLPDSGLVEVRKMPGLLA